jgi:hypothetical protein
MPTTPVGTISGASGTVGSTPVNTGAAATPTYVVANPPTTPVSAPLFSVNGPTTPIAPAAGAGLTFAALIAQTPGAATHAGSFSADSIFVQHCTSLSAINEVHNPLLFDPILAQDYPTLCNLRCVVLIAIDSFSNLSVLPGLVS